MDKWSCLGLFDMFRAGWGCLGQHHAFWFKASFLLFYRESNQLPEHLNCCYINNVYNYTCPITQAEDSTEALAWYNYSLTFLLRSDPEHESLAKLQRNRASCYLNLQQLDKVQPETVLKIRLRRPRSCDYNFQGAIASNHCIHQPMHTAKSMEM